MCDKEGRGGLKASIPQILSLGVGGRAPKNGDTLKMWWPKVILMSNHVNKHNLVKKVEKSPI